MIRYSTAKNKANTQASQLPNANSTIKVATPTDAAYPDKNQKRFFFSDHAKHDK